MATFLWMVAFFAYGEEYLKRDDFLRLAFGDTIPAVQSFWLTQDARDAAKSELEWSPRGLRFRYWQQGQRTAWILEEIGKEKPITVGIVIDNQQIHRVDVLAFRESRGWEIRYPFFTEQFSGLTLANDGYLSDHIDGITGATLSVRAVEKMSRRALWLSAQVD